MMKIASIIVAGGSSSRYPSDTLKQFTLINNKMVLDYSVQKMQKFCQKIVVVVPEDYFTLMKKHYISIKNITVCVGGKSRQHSVLNGLSLLKDVNPNIVLVHDGARLLVSEKMILDSIELAQEKKSATPIVAFSDSLWLLNDDKSLSTRQKREKFVISQTPQTFDFQQLLAAHLNLEDSLEDYSDCSGVYAHSFQKVYTYPGEKNNIKLTFHEDLEFIYFILNNK